MKKIIGFLLVCAFLFGACNTMTEAPSAKIAINIEGFVTSIYDSRITLDNGQVVIITDETQFETENVGKFLPVNKNIRVGNYIQGFTFDDTNLPVVTAAVISSNGILEISMRSVVVNIEGIITEVSEEGKRFKLDSGKWVLVTQNTELGITGPNAAPKDEQYFEPTFRIGNSIAGFTEDESDDILVAYAIYTNWNWENPIR